MHLPALQSHQQMFTLMGFQQPWRLAELLGLDLNLTGGLSQTQQVLEQLIAVAEPTVSGLILEPEISFPLFLEKFKQVDQGLVLSFAHHSTDMASLPTLLSQWSVDEVANNYAVAYLPVFYHPAEELALEKKKLIAEIHDSCQHAGIDLILDLSVYLQADQPNTPAVFQETQFQAIQELRGMAEMLVAQYPEDPLGAATITAELDIPWVVSFVTTQYEDMKQQLRLALENGAQGCVISEALWPELGTIRQADASPNMPAIEEYINTKVRDRIIELTRITNEFGKD